MNPKLLQLLLDNRRADGKPHSYIEAAKSAEDEAQVFLYDPIVGQRWIAEMFGYVCAQDLVPQLEGIQAKTIRLRINCPGGDVFAMQAIMNSIRNHPARVIAQVDGIAASAATAIAMVCDEVIMQPGTNFMIHNSQGMAMGDKNDMLAMAELQGKVDASLAQSYADKTGKSLDEIAAWMDAETWFTAEEAVANGFANQVMKPEKKSAKAATEWNLTAFANAPKPAEPEKPAESVAEKPPEPTYITNDHRERQQQRVRIAALLTSS